MSFKDLLIQAKDGSHYAQEKIFLLYRPLLFKEACVYEVFDEDLFQELSMTLVDCIRLFQLYAAIGVGLARGTDANGLECWYCVQLFLRSGYSISAVDKPATK